MKLKLTTLSEASHIYGSDDERSNYIREFENGRNNNFMIKIVQISIHFYNCTGRLLEHDEYEGICPSIEQVSKIQKKDISVSFMGNLIAGDNRVNETPGLSVIHSRKQYYTFKLKKISNKYFKLKVWVRHHNKIAAEFSKIKPKWTDETIFQETR